VGVLAVGASGTASFAVTVDDPVPAGVTQISNSATIADGSASDNAGDNTPVVIAPALNLDKSDNGATAVPGGSVVYTLGYANTGNVGLSGVTLQETVPANTAFDAANSDAGWSCAGTIAGSICTLNVGVLAVGASGTADFAVTVANPLPAGVSQVSNSATVSASGGTTASGGDATPIVTAPGLSLSKSDSGATTTPGGTVVYTLSYANTGNVDLTGVVLTETVPANTTFDAANSDAGWSCVATTAGSTCTLNVGALASGASDTADFAVTVANPLAAGVTQISNSASIANGTTSAANSDSTPVNTSPALSLTKTGGVATVAPGGTLVYTLNYANSGNVGLSGVTSGAMGAPVPLVPERPDSRPFDIDLASNGGSTVAAWLEPEPYYCGFDPCRETGARVVARQLGSSLESLGGGPLLAESAIVESPMLRAFWTGSEFVVAWTSVEDLHLRTFSAGGSRLTDLTVHGEDAKPQIITPNGTIVFLRHAPTTGAAAVVTFANGAFGEQSLLKGPATASRIVAALPDNRVAYAASGPVFEPPYHGAARIQSTIGGVSIPPAVPSAPRLTASADDRTVTLAWTRPAGPVNGYRVEYRIADGTWNELERWLPAGSSTTSIRVASRARTSFRIRAWNDGGVGAYSEIAAVYAARRRSVR
jgi:uncharacterized repeat protein (TIGR01451 family)